MRENETDIGAEGTKKITDNPFLCAAVITLVLPLGRRYCRRFSPTIARTLSIHLSLSNTLFSAFFLLIALNQEAAQRDSWSIELG